MTRDREHLLDQALHHKRSHLPTLPDISSFPKSVGARAQWPIAAGVNDSVQVCPKRIRLCKAHQEWDAMNMTWFV